MATVCVHVQDVLLLHASARLLLSVCMCAEVRGRHVRPCAQGQPLVRVSRGHVQNVL